MCKTIRRTLRNNIRKYTNLSFYEVYTVPRLTVWVTTLLLHKRRIQAAEMMFLKAVKWCRRIYFMTNEHVRRELDVFWITEKKYMHLEKSGGSMWKEEEEYEDGSKWSLKTTSYNHHSLRLLIASVPFIYQNTREMYAFCWPILISCYDRRCRRLIAVKLTTLEVGSKL